MNRYYSHRQLKVQERSVRSCRDIHENAFWIDLLAHILILEALIVSGNDC